MSIDLDALEDRLWRAVVELEGSADRLRTRGWRSANDAGVWLDAKAEGVNLALSYLQEARRLAADGAA